MTHGKPGGGGGGGRPESSNLLLGKLGGALWVRQFYPGLPTRQRRVVSCLLKSLSSQGLIQHEYASWVTFTGSWLVPKVTEHR